MMILVDSSIFIDWLRNRIDPTKKLINWIHANEICSCGIIRAEVLRGIIKANQRQRIQEFFGILPEIQLTSGLLQEVSQLAWSLDRKGRIVPLTDLIIAVAAMKAEATVISLDHHFKSIPKLKTRKSLPQL
ncbi:MAG TPA: PIN domain-containing protein [Verrucomicrobiales bacterium]|jgi:hypothetical protein|nr:PIN domain-containing protein [Verrucomicrobiales bacterium]HIL68358.1 PIN domain-containing protein [Verrucomicrobiota bacterium]